MPTPESFLRAFHDRDPGVTTRAYARGRSPRGSSYEILASVIPPAATILDLGCGDGFLLELLRAPPRRLIGLDLSAGELARARQRPTLADAALVRADARAIPVATASLDACVSHLAFTLMSEPDRVATEVARTLRPGGLFAAIVGGGPAVTGGANAFDAFLDLVPPAATPRLGDPRARDPAGLEAVLGAAGFSAITYQRHVIDLGGTADEVWSTLSTLYELAALAPSARAALRASPLFAADRIACAMAVGLVQARR
jgi:SAM-dependent methyltransferase